MHHFYSKLSRLVFTFEGSSKDVRSRASKIQDWLHFGLAGNHNSLQTEAAGGSSILISSLEIAREAMLRKQAPEAYTPKKVKI